MSGGHFDYKQFHIHEIAEEIEDIIISNKSKEKNEWGEEIGYHFPPEIIAKFVDGVNIIKTAYVYAQRIDWLLSGDDGKESFLDRLEEDIKEVNYEDFGTS